MQIRTLWGQRVNSYPGETLPELMVAWGEHDLEDNFAGYVEAKNTEIAAWGTDLVEHHELLIEVDDDDIMNLFKIPVSDAVKVSEPEAETNPRGLSAQEMVQYELERCPICGQVDSDCYLRNSDDLWVCENSVEILHPEDYGPLLQPSAAE